MYKSSASQRSQQITVLELAKISLVTALYIVVTGMLSAISFGAIQLRLSEMFNYLALYHKRYIVAVTLGVVLVNFLSPTWMFDVPIGGTATLLMLILCRTVTKHMKSNIGKMAVTAILFSFSMFTVAGQLTLLLGLPFFETWLLTGLGELLSMTIGGIVIHLMSKKIDLTKFVS